MERQPTLSYLSMNAPEAEQQIVSGLYAPEVGRWTAGRAVILLKSPAAATPLRAKFYIPDAAPARRVTLLIDGEQVADQTYSKPGFYTLEAARMRPAGTAVTLTVVVDKTFSVGGDRRELGIVLGEAGFP